MIPEESIGVDDSVNYCVLLIDNDALDTDNIANSLSQCCTEKFHLTHSSTLNQGLSSLNSTSFDCILLDLSLPDSTGLATLRKINQFAQDTPIILLTNDDEPDTVNPALQAGAQDHLSKKIISNTEILVRTIRYSVRQFALQRQLEVSYSHQQHLSYYDPITSIPNRLLFLDRLERMILESKRGNAPFTLCFLSLDGFKHINETIGHGAGDEVLISVAARLLKITTHEDTVARLSGDEFTLLFKGLHKKRDVEKNLTKLSQEISRPIPYGDKICSTSASIGIAIFPQDGACADELLKNANIAMCKAKKNVLERHQFFSQELAQEQRARYEMECALIEALQPQCQQLLLQYLPRVSLASNEVVGVEALIRWQHPQLGLLYPAAFIPLATQAGLMVSLDQWVLERVCVQICSWKAAKQEILPVSVHVSAETFKQQDFPDSLLATLKQHAVAPTQLEIELAESTLIEDIDKNTSKLDPPVRK